MPNRYLHDELLTDPRLCAVSDCAQALFFRLALVADDYGRFDAEPCIVLARCYPRLIMGALPLDRVVERLDELARGRIMQRYTIAERTYGALLLWGGRPRAARSKFPEPPVELESNPHRLHGSSMTPTSIPIPIPKSIASYSQNYPQEQDARADETSSATRRKAAQRAPARLDAETVREQLAELERRGYGRPTANGGRP